MRARMKKVKKLKRLLAGMLGAALLISGCGAGNGAAEGQGGEASKGQTPGPLEEKQIQNNTAITKGRYVEREIPYEENSHMNAPAAIQARENGLYLLDVEYLDAKVDLGNYPEGSEIKNIGLADLPAAIRGYRETGKYISEMAMAENGARMYSIFVSDGETGDKFYYDKYFLDASGNESPWDAEGAVGRETRAVYFCGDDGNFYVLVRGIGSAVDGGERRLYRVDSESGETKFLMDFPDEIGADNIMVFGGRLFAATYEKMHIFDLATLEEQEEDKVLNELIGSSFMEDNGYRERGYLLRPGKDDSVYVVTEKGLYRHVLYGNVSELLIDGSLCSLGDVSKLFTDMYVDEDGENGMPIFYILYGNGKLIRFAYDPQMPSVPEKTITLYSLMESSDIRLAITAYQALHPEVYVRYEIGMSGQDGTTRDDALNSLATRIAAGEGPDIFLLDDLPWNSYVEKGVLMDLSGLYGELKGKQNYFDNIVSALYRDDKLYTIPMMFGVPILVGDEKALQEITDAEGMVRAVENCSVPNSMRIGLGKAYSVLQCMASTNSGRWLAADGSLDREALADFLGLCKRLYEADCADISEEKLEKRMSVHHDFGTSYTSGQQYRNCQKLGSRVLDKVIYGNAFVFGIQSGNINAEFNYDYAVIQKADADYMLMPGDGRVCLPFAMLGINAATPIPEAAGDFVKYALSDYLMETNMISGIPINRDVLLAMEQNNPYGDSEHLSYGIGFVGEDGEDVFIDIDAPWQEMAVYEEYNAKLDSINAVNVTEYELMSAVLENGAPALTGEKSIEETVDAIAKKVQLYLAE